MDIDTNRFKQRPVYRPTRPAVPVVARGAVAAPAPAPPSAQAVPVQKAVRPKKQRFTKLVSRARAVRLPLPGRQAQLRLAIGMAVLVVGVIGYQILKPNTSRDTANFGAASIPASTTVNSSSKSAAATQSSASSLGVVPEPSSPKSVVDAAPAAASQLNFIPAVPQGKPQLAKLGSTSFNSSEDSYTFNDLYLAEPLQISEQPLPTTYPTAAAAISTVALSAHAATAITTNSLTGYLATDNSTGDQTVVFSTKGLLILIKSTYQHTVTQWAGYLNSLQ